jgi:hypothetical protein
MRSAVVQSSCARQLVVAWLSGRLVPGLGCLFFLEAGVCASREPGCGRRMPGVGPTSSVRASERRLVLVAWERRAGKTLRLLLLLALSTHLWGCRDRRDRPRPSQWSAWGLHEALNTTLGPFECKSRWECPPLHICKDIPGDGQFKRFCLEERRLIVPGGCRDNADCPPDLVCDRGHRGQPGTHCMDVCAAGRACSGDGQCQSHNGGCVATTERDCQKSFGCEQSGRCVLSEGACVVSQESCQKSGGCRQRGLCIAKEGACVTNEEVCQASTKCTHHGLCSMRAGACEATSNEDCERSVECQNNGACVVSHGLCAVGADAGCRLSAQCRKYGKCRGSEGQCVAGTDEDCLASEQCQLTGACSRSGTSCSLRTAEGCAGSLRCRQSGACRLHPNGACVVGEAVDCERSEACKSHGLCALGSRECKAGPTEACRRSTRCETEGLCTLDGGRCKVTSDADCARSQACKEDGRCRADPAFGRCVVNVRARE